MDFRVFSRNISENMHARCVREDTKQALKGNLQADGVQSRQTLFVRYCPKETAFSTVPPAYDKLPSIFPAAGNCRSKTDKTNQGELGDFSIHVNCIPENTDKPRQAA